MIPLSALVGPLVRLAILLLACAAAAGWSATARAQEEPPPEEAPAETPGDTPEDSPGEVAEDAPDGAPGDSPDATAASEPGEEGGEPADGVPDVVEHPEDGAAPAAVPAATDEEVPAADAALPDPAPANDLSPPSADAVEETSSTDAAAADGVEGEEAPAAWRGSVIEYRNAFGIIGLDPGAELTHNPYYAMFLSLRPRWWFGDILNVSARLDFGGELTQTDDTTYANETVVQDLLLNVGASKLYRIPVADIDVSTSLRVTLPTSKVSRARTLALGLGPAVALAREFPLDSAGSLTVGYNARFSMLFHGNTTSEYETPLIPGCSPANGGCESFLNSGYRNTQFRLANGVDVSYDPMDWMGVSISYLHIMDWLYPIEANDPRISYAAEPNTDMRYRSAFGLEAYFTPTPMLEIGVGYETVSPQQEADSSYYNPLYNRYSTGYVDLRLQVEALVDQIVEITRGQDR